MKILSDFDGVWTDQAAEAAHVLEHFVLRSALLARVEPARARHDFQRLRLAMEREPERHGWASDPHDPARLTAFVDEDPLLASSSLARSIGLSGAPPFAAAYREAIFAGGHPTLTEFANRCFLEATEQFRGSGKCIVVPGARRTFETLSQRGIEVVIVSNSSSAKILGWLSPLGLPVVDHAEGLRGPQVLRVRGHAAKYGLGPSREALDVERRQVALDRPHYRRVLEEEAPDLVVGDVFSLDLALPLALRERGQAGGARSLVLRRHPHTPAWVRRLVESKRIDGAIDRLEQLLTWTHPESGPDRCGSRRDDAARKSEL